MGKTFAVLSTMYSTELDEDLYQQLFANRMPELFFILDFDHIDENLVFTLNCAESEEMPKSQAIFFSQAINFEFIFYQIL